MADTRHIRFVILAGLLCLGVADAAVAEEKAAGQEPPEWITSTPPGAGVGAADSAALSFAHALNELACIQEVSIGGYGGCGYNVGTSKADQTICGFQVTSTLEDGRWELRVKGQIVDELRVSLTLQIASTPEGMKDSEGQTVQFLLKSVEEKITRKMSPLNASAQRAKEREGGTPIHLLKAGDGELPGENEEPKNTLQLEMKPPTVGIQELIQHARSRGCTIERAEVEAKHFTLIRVPPTSE